MGAILSAVVWSVAGCGGDPTDSDVLTPGEIGTGTGTTAGPGTGTTAGTGTGTTEPGATDCIWVGTWVADEALCNGAPYYDFFTFYDEMRLDITHGRVNGCDIVATWTSSACVESETWFVDPERDDKSVTMEGKGITECTPDLCKFVGADLACEIGDRARDQVVPVDQKLDIGRLAFTHLVAYSAPTCESEFRLRFVKQ